MRLSVVIPTRDRPGVVADCVETLVSQDVPDGGMEVVIVDDGSEEQLTVEAGGPIPVCCVRQRPQGLNVARNRGVEETSGELVAFLDDDTLVTAGWAAAMVEGFAEGDVNALGGRITLQFDGPRPAWLTPRHYSFLSAYDLGPHPRDVTTRRALPFGANFAVRRRTLERVGGFRPDLDRIGSRLISNGETEFLLRVLGEPGRIVYWPAASVAHRVPPQRLTMEWFRERALAQGMSDVRTIPPGRRTDAIVRGLLLFRELIFIAGGLPQRLRQFATERSRFDIALWWAYCRGRREEAKRYRLGP